MDRRRYFPSFLWNSVAKLGDFGFAWLFTVLLARLLGPAEYGSFASILSVCTFVTVLASSGIDNTLHRFLGETGAAGADARRIPRLVRALFSARLALTAALVAAVFLARGWIAARFENEAMAGLIASSVLYLVSQSLALFGANVLVGLLRTKAVAVFTVCVRVANIALAIALVRSGAGVPAIMLMLGGTSVALALAYGIAIVPLSRGPRGETDLSPVFSFAAFSWVLAAVGFGLGRQSDVILLNAIRHDQAEVALYDVAYSLAQTLPMVLTVGMTGIALALFSKRVRSRPEGLASLWRTLTVVVGTVTFPLLVFAIVHARACVVAVYGAGYADAGSLLRAYAIPAAASWLLGGGASSTALHAVSRVRTVLLIRTVTGLANIAANIVLIRAWGAAGALLGTGLCGAWAVVWETAAVARATGSPPALGHAAGVAAAIACALAPSVVFPPRGLAALCAHAALFAALFLGVLRLLRPLPALDEGLVLALPPKVASAVRLFTRAPHAA